MKPTRLAAAALMIAACTPDKNTPEYVLMTNPLTAEYNTPHGIPPFEKIKTADFLPAVEAAISEREEAIDEIVESPDAPTFENTVLALENSGRNLENAYGIFSNLNSACTDDEMQALAREISPKISAHRDNVSLNESLFNRLKAIYDQRDGLELNPEELALLKDKYDSFTRSGALLSNDKKARLREINARLSLLTTDFGQNVLAETNAFQLYVEDESLLKGLSASFKQSAAEKAEEKGKEGQYLFTLHNPSVMPFLESAENRGLRKKIWEAYVNRGNNGNANDNNEIIREITALRAERAKLLGFTNHAAYVLDESMAGSTERVDSLLDQIWKPALRSARNEAEQFSEMIRASGDSSELKPWDWRYYESKLRRDKFSLDAEEVKPYFSAEGVGKGIFEVCKRLYGITFHKLDGVPLYHPNVEVYGVKEADGTQVGVLFIDLYARPSKRGGAWMTSYRKQEKDGDTRIPPLISIVCNFTPPSGSGPALLSFDEVTTYFHEFGHALHGLLSDVRFRSMSGTSVYRDFVELPSQVLENWATAPEVLRMYARHYKTGEPIPDALIEKIVRSRTFGEGFATAEYMASVYLDMAYHKRNSGIEESAAAFEAEVMREAGLPEQIVPRHRSTYFNHIFSGGYSSNYYSYIWSAVLDADAFRAFTETGDLFHSETARMFREYILAKGGTEDPMELYVKFRGAEPHIAPLLERRGLTESAVSSR